MSATPCLRTTCDATLRNLELVGEAAPRVPDAVRDLAPPWRKIVGTRNRLIHAYLVGPAKPLEPAWMLAFTGETQW